MHGPAVQLSTGRNTLDGAPSESGRMLRLRSAFVALVCGAFLLLARTSGAGEIFMFSDASGLTAEAEFTLLNPMTLEIRLKNLSSGVPAGFDSADQLLTGISFDIGAQGVGDPEITGGSVKIGPTSQSVNFDQVMSQLGPGEDVTGEYGYGNSGGSGALTNFVSAHIAHGTPFGGTNLDGPLNLSGPQGGLIANPIPMSIGGLGAIQNEVIITVTLDSTLANLDFLAANGVRFEFGSDAAFFTIPEPQSFVLFGLGVAGLLAYSRRRVSR